MDNYKFITVKSKEIFSKYKNEIPKQSLTFIEDSREIYANGVTFNSVSLPADITTINNKAVKLGTFNDKAISVKLDNIEEYNYGALEEDDTVYYGDPLVKNEILIVYNDFIYNINIENKRYNIYTTMVLPQEDITISFPVTYLCQNYNIKLKADSGIIIDAHILNDGNILIKTKSVTS
jgi:hypothetical protein